MQNLDKAFFTLEEYREKVAATQTDKDAQTVYLYTNQPDEHHAYIAAATAKGYDVLLNDRIIDSHFVQYLEQKIENTNFKRVDADTIDRLITHDETIESVLTETQQETVKNVFLAQTGSKSVELRALAATDAPVQIVRPEFMRRMTENQALQGMDTAMFGDMYNVVVNTNHPLVTTNLLAAEGDAQNSIAAYLYDLARLQQGLLKGADLAAFVARSLAFVQ